MQYWTGLKSVVTALWKVKRKNEDKGTKTKWPHSHHSNKGPTSSISTGSENSSPAAATSSTTRPRRGQSGKGRNQSNSGAGGRKAAAAAAREIRGGGECERDSFSLSEEQEEQSRKQEQPIIQIVASAASSLSQSHAVVPLKKPATPFLVETISNRPKSESSFIGGGGSTTTSTTSSGIERSISSRNKQSSYINNRVGSLESAERHIQKRTTTGSRVSRVKELKETTLSLFGDLTRRPWKKLAQSVSEAKDISPDCAISTTSPTRSLGASSTDSCAATIGATSTTGTTTNPNTSATTANKRWNTRHRKNMDHEDLVAELSQIEKLSNQERLRLAHKRRMLQLKKYQHYEKDWNSKKGKMLQNQIEQNKKRRIRFRSSIMLLEAAGRNDIEEVRKLLESHHMDPDVANEDGLTALHQCCIDDNEEMMKLLLDFGANVNSEDSERWSPLHAAATCGHLNIVKYLIAKGANLLAVNAEGNMPYDICDEEATLDFIESEMAKRGVTQELIEEIRALPETRMLQDMQIIQSEGGDLEYRDADGATPLLIAAGNGYTRVVEFLLDNHVATDATDKDLWTATHASACWGHMEVLELLVQNGADLNARTKNNETPYAICEDPEIKERIIQLRSEQETKLKDAARRKIRRSQSSNSRTQSIRRTSQRDKGLTSKRDVADEAQMLKAINIKDDSPSPTHDMMEKSNGINHNTNSNLNNHNNHHETSSEEEPEEKGKSQPPFAFGKDSISEIKMGVKEMERLSAIAVKSGAFPSNAANNKHANNINKPYTNPIAIPITDSNANLPKAEVNPPVDSKVQIASGLPLPLSGSTDSLGGNSTIDIHVSVTINTNNASNGVPNGVNTPPSKDSMSNMSYTPPGTLADLKKQRSLRHGRQQANALINGIVNEMPTKYEAPASPTISLRRFAGDPGEIVGDYSDGGKKCCVIV